MIKELKYDVTKDDFKKAPEDILNVKRYKNQRIKIAVLFAILCFLGTLFAMVRVNNIFIEKIIMLTIPPLAAYIIFFFSYKRALDLSMKEMNKGKNYNDNILKINSEDNYFIDSNSSNETKYNWTAIKDIYNAKYNFLIFIADYQAIIIPKRNFNSEEEMNETWNLIQECYNKSR